MSRNVAVGVLMLVLSGCSGGGGHSASSTPPAPVSSVIPAGSFLSGPGAAYAGPESGFAFTGGTFNSGTSGNGGATVTLTNDASTGTARFLSISAPAGVGSTYSHTFDLANSAPGTGPLAGLIGVLEGTQFSDGSVQHELVLDPNLNFATYGLWVNVQSVSVGVESGATGAFAIGQLTPAAAIPTTGSATYAGSTIGAMINGTTSALLTGSVNLTANFNSMSVNGSMVLNSWATGAPAAFANLTLGPAPISAGNGGSYSGPLNGSGFTGSASGNFYGPHAEETAGTWAITNNAGTNAIGSFGAKKQ